MIYVIVATITVCLEFSNAVTGRRKGLYANAKTFRPILGLSRSDCVKRLCIAQSAAAERGRLHNNPRLVKWLACQFGHAS